ncbi:MAG TPA: hypothetical protein VGK52_10805 [Polyangia bacterium]
MTPRIFHWRHKQRWIWGAGVLVSVALHAVPLAVTLRRAPTSGPVEVTILAGAPTVGAELDRASSRAARDHENRSRVPPRAPPRPRSAPRAHPRESEEAPAKSGPKTPPERSDVPAEVTQLVGFGPEGSRLTLFIRLDRLKATPFAQAARDLIVRVPGMSDLLRGTELDLYDAFDTLVIATPDPRSPASTFLAARHHLAEDDMRAALNRGAEAAGQRLAWRVEDGHPIAERRARTDEFGSDGSTAAEDDTRLVMMAAPGLVVVAPRAYGSLLTAASAQPAAARDAGGDAEPPAIAFDGLSLRLRLDAQGEALGADDLAIVSGVDLNEPWARQALSLGSNEAPHAISVVVQSPGEPSIVVRASLSGEIPAQRWASALPRLRQRALAAGRELAPWIRVLENASVDRATSIVELRLALSDPELGELWRSLAGD